MRKNNVALVVSSCVSTCVMSGTRRSGRTYTVVHGDTPWKIAERFLGKGSRYTEIVKLNGLKSNVLMSGQVLQIPEK